MKFLLEHGADVNLPTDVCGMTDHGIIVMYACSNVLQDAVRCSPLRAACYQGCIDVARVLLEHGAVVDYQDNVLHAYSHCMKNEPPLFYRMGTWLLSPHANEVKLKL